MLDARQLGLKLIANVTYGYTSASYSGRMPCVEVCCNQAQYLSIKSNVKSSISIFPFRGAQGLFTVMVFNISFL